MLEIEASLELLKKYGYSSTNSHPYLYQSGDTIGICYTYVDEDYGTLERVKIFDSYEAFDEFLKRMEWLKKNGLNYHVRMCLDDYESINPKTLFLRNEKLMIEGEMEDIETFDFKEAQREQMDEASKILYEAGDLFLIYDEIKERQLQYLLKIISLKNQLRQKYYDLQSAVDKYNKIKIEREFVKIPEVPDSGGIDIQSEIALKDQYNLYIREIPSVEEVTAFLKEVWNLNRTLELNTRYYDALREETEIRNEMKIVEKKLALMEKLNDNIKPLFGVDLVSRFRKINKSLGSTINEVSKSIVEEKINLVKDKYKYYGNIDPLYVSDYLREAIQNTNYEDLAIKYSKGAPLEQAKKSRTPLNEIASSLFIQFKNSLSVDEQAILVIYSNEKFRKICNAILAIPNFSSFTPKQIVKKINGIKGFSKLKSECYISVRNRINDPLNQPIKEGLFNVYDFTSFETFIGSLVKELGKIKQINNKMHLDGDINMYVPIKNVDDVRNKEFILVTNDINTLTSEAKVNHNPIGITLLKEGLPVMYSPYFLDLGDIYNKNASPKMEIREVINFELLIDVSDVFINVDKNKTSVINYFSEIEVEGNVSIVKDIKSSGKTIFVKYALIPNSQVKHLDVQETEEETTPIQSSQASAVVEINKQVAEQNVAPVMEQPTNPVPVEVETNQPETTPETGPVNVNNMVPINQVVNGVNAEEFNQTVDDVIDKAVESGSMVAIASQAANNENVGVSIDNPNEEKKEEPEKPEEPTNNEITNSGFTSLGEENNEDDSSSEESQEIQNQEPSDVDEDNKEEKETTPAIDLFNPFSNKSSLEEINNKEEETVKEDSDETEEDTAPEEKEEANDINTESNEESNINEDSEIDDKEEIIPKDSQAEDNTEQVDVPLDSSEKKEEDLDKLLDTLATSLPKDLSKDIGDTSKMQIFTDLDNDDEETDKPEEKEQHKELPKEDVVQEKEEKSNDSSIKESSKEMEPEKEEPKKENEAKEETSTKGIVKTQIVKKTITNPDGTKKVVTVRRTITTKPKSEASEDDSGEKKVKKVVRKIGQPVSDKKTIIKKVENKSLDEK